MCAAWIADDRGKEFFAHVGAGTIDQALLGVLPSRHQALRLWGLADHVLIIDEAHSYDPYVNKEMERLIEFHAALGGSAIFCRRTWRAVAGKPSWTPFQGERHRPERSKSKAASILF